MYYLNIYNKLFQYFFYKCWISFFNIDLVMTIMLNLLFQAKEKQNEV